MNQFSTLILIFLAIAFLLRIDFVFYIIYVCIGVYAWSRWVVPRTAKNLHSGRTYATHSFWGESVTITIYLKNEGRLPVPWVRVTESVAVQLRQGPPVNTVMALGHKKQVALTYTIAARRRGFYQIGPLRLTMGDLFGIQPERHAQLPAEYITIYPRIIPLVRLGLPSRLPFGILASQQRLFADPARPMGAREFRSGDSLRQINWKASAHTRQLLVRTYEPAISLETAVLLDLHTDSYTRQSRANTIEWAIEVAASLAAHLVNQRQAVGLITNGIDPLAMAEGPVFDENSGRLLRHTAAALSANPTALLPPAIPPRHGRNHLVKILERLARIENENTVPLTAWATEATAHLSWGVTILAITARGTEAVCQTLHRLARAGYNPVLMAVEPDANFAQVRERARRLGFSAYLVAAPHDLDRWRAPDRVTR
ncbi:MAG: DUF58 domain-containing protein [Anaerolineae bacterium]|nr:DUF58 domain-containing protein [Anaerolineae bacterium]